MDRTLTVINTLEAEGIIGKYAIGGAIGLIFYVEPTATYDLDIFCHLPQSGLLINLGPLYANLAKKGYQQADGEHIKIEGIPVQFLCPPTDLVRDALDNAVEKEFGGVKTRVFQYEHLLAIMAETNRTKDKIRIAQALESVEPDQAKLNDILKRHNLLDRWSRITT
ncbi:MAG: hypothetical protein IT342_01540 [Candidatus Melainabacteria bacterium]|nr:hypothetical protein [Candidatus Melainabacteria bacterium]